MNSEPEPNGRGPIFGPLQLAILFGLFLLVVGWAVVMFLK